jgi:hypothetical protein
MATPYYPRHRDDEWVDEIRIRTVPRFKESELSGDEWRTSVNVEVMRKGMVMRTERFHRVRDAVLGLGSVVGFAPADYRDTEAGWDARLTDDKCFQPGCSEDATVEVRKIRQSCHEGHVTDIDNTYSEAHVRWCEAHKYRGDASLDDADTNYAALE